VWQLSAPSALLLCEFAVVGLPDAAWAFATPNRGDEHLFRALARKAGRRVAEFNTWNRANTAWACARVKLFDEKPSRSEAGRSVRKFNALELANTAWAFARVSMLTAHVIRALA